jgi:D-cysteine desulfhydrase
VTDKVIDHLARERLAALPTPMTAAPGLVEGLGDTKLWIKRDDLIDFGFGGNKVRGLEFLLADAKKEKATTLVTGAGVLSNHVRATAAAASHAGLGMSAVYWGNEPERCEGNHLLTRILGADMHFTNTSDRASVDHHIDLVAENLRKDGKRPYSIPRGGACALGVVGHILAAEEVAAQCQTLKITPERIIMAVGSGGTLAGWLLGSKLLGLNWKIEAYTVSRPAEEVRARVRALAQQAAELMGTEVSLLDEDIVVHDGVIGDGYGIPSPDGQRAIAFAAHRQGIFFDPTYTGKAFAGFMKDAASGRFSGLKAVLFLHTGGAPSLFAGSGGVLA